jgi:hypothetical protein
MPCSYTIDETHGLVLSLLSGIVIVDEVFAHQNSLAADPKFNPEFNQLLDAGEVTRFQLSTEEMRAIAKRTIFAPKVRRAFVATGTLLHGIGRMLAAFREIEGGEEEVQIFHNRAEALRWLAERPVTPRSA